ncbi:MAG: hypothetical protein VR72_02795 [Clostridiaceae bacterium BRH_c20a]|nr:MAG: hypothetical protein VR72_02795 [Clostridiaceae bacterium BRH_c20a]
MNWGLCLSGGGVRGGAHIGVLKVLEENGLKPKYITGTSAGAIVSGLYSCGYSAKTIEEIVSSLDLKKYIDLDINGILDALKDLVVTSNTNLTGLVNGNTLEDLFKELLSDKFINQAQIPLGIIAVDINTAEVLKFTSQPIEDHGNSVNITDCKIHEAIRASIAIPGYFKPKIFKNHMLVDGGIRDNLPLDLLIELGAEKMLLVNVGFVEKNSENVHGIAEIAVQALDIMMYDSFKKSLLSLENKDNILILNTPMPDIKPLDFKKLNKAIEIGYEETQRQLPKIREFLINN